MKIICFYTFANETDMNYSISLFSEDGQVFLRVKILISYTIGSLRLGCLFALSQFSAEFKRVINIWFGWILLDRFIFNEQKFYDNWSA